MPYYSGSTPLFASHACGFGSVALLVQSCSHLGYWCPQPQRPVRSSPWFTPRASVLSQPNWVFPVAHATGISPFQAQLGLPRGLRHEISSFPVRGGMSYTLSANQELLFWAASVYHGRPSVSVVCSCESPTQGRHLEHRGPQAKQPPSWPGNGCISASSREVAGGSNRYKCPRPGHNDAKCRLGGLSSACCSNGECTCGRASQPSKREHRSRPSGTFSYDGRAKLQQRLG